MKMGTNQTRKKVTNSKTKDDILPEYKTLLWEVISRTKLERKRENREERGIDRKSGTET